MNNTSKWALTFILAFAAGSIQVLAAQQNPTFPSLLIHGGLALLPAIAALKATLDKEADNTWKWIGVLFLVFASGSLASLVDANGNPVAVTGMDVLRKGLIALLPTLMSLKMTLDPVPEQPTPNPPAPPAAPGA